MTEQEWLTCTDPQKMLESLSGKASDRKLRLFAVASCRRLGNLLTDERSKRAVETAEMFADGLATDEDREAALKAAWNVKKEGLLLQEAQRENESCGAEQIKAEATLWAAEAGAWTVAEAALQAANSSSLVLQGALELEAAYLMSRSTGMTTEAQAVAMWEAHLFGGDEEKKKAACSWFSEKAAIARSDLQRRKHAAAEKERCRQSDLLRDFFNLAGLGTAPRGLVVKLAQAIYDERRFEDLPTLADALEEDGCTDPTILSHCRGPGPHTRGCCVVDAILGKT
jgi:hypothetical protein